MTTLATRKPRGVSITVGGAMLGADLEVPPHAIGLVIVPHGSGASRLTPRNHEIARLLNAARFATLTCDLLTAEEDVASDLTGAYRTDAGLLADRLTEITDWATRQPGLGALPIAYFATGSAAPAALMATAQRPGVVRALVIRGGRLDGALTSLGWVRAPTLLIAPELNQSLQSHYEMCLDWLGARDRELVVIPRASMAFDEPHTVDDMIDYTTHFLASRLAVEPPAGHELLVRV